MRGLLLLAVCAAAFWFASQARAHPHVFVDVGLRFEADAEGRIVSVEVTWTYDELFSLLVLSDRGLDQDADLVLTQGEQFELLGFDLKDWPDGFEGALFLETDAGKVALGAPQAQSVHLEGPKLVTRHRRAVEPLQVERFVVRAYDPSYYAALELSDAFVLPEACDAEILAPELALAEAKLESLNVKNSEALFDEVQIGIYFADTLRVTCATPS